MTLEEWLQIYADSHQNPKNQTIHKVCVPLIMWCVMALTYSLPSLQYAGVNMGLFHIVIIGSLGFYFRLGQNVGMVMLAACSFFFLTILLFEETRYLWQIALFLFIISWIFQFYGHKIEGKKPSFIEDVKFLLIGPLWVMRHLKVL